MDKKKFGQQLRTARKERGLQAIGVCAAARPLPTGNTDLPPHDCRHGAKGYTLTELLVTISIVAISCSIAIPSLVAVNRRLEFKGRNDNARILFLAAQAQLSQMRADGQLEQLTAREDVHDVPPPQENPNNASDFPKADWNSQYVYTSSEEDAFDQILPPGAVDEAIREGQILIEYNSVSGDVYAVFYSEAGTALTYGTLCREESERKKQMLGYYAGSSIFRDSAALDNKIYRARMTYENGEEGIVTIRIPIPDSYVCACDAFLLGLEVTLEIQREAVSEKPIARDYFMCAVKERNQTDGCRLSKDGQYVEITYVLDSLRDKGSFLELCAENMASDPTESENLPVFPGENVTIFADVEFYPAGGSPQVEILDAIAPGIQPMFGGIYQCNDDECYILTVENGRNLQNLSALAPSVAEKVRSVNIAQDIDWANTVSYYREAYGMDLSAAMPMGYADGNKPT